MVSDPNGLNNIFKNDKKAIHSFDINYLYCSVASLVSVHHLRPRTGLVGPVSVENDWVDWSIMFICGMVLLCAGTLKSSLRVLTMEFQQTTTVIHSYKLLIIDFKPVHSLTYNLE